MKGLKNKKYLVHAFAWIAIILINLFVIRGFDHSMVWIRLAVSTLIWFIYFYLNYSVLIPKLLFRHKIFAYIILTASLTVGAYFGSKYSDVRLNMVDIQKQEEALKQYDDVKESYDQKVDEFRSRRGRRESQAKSKTDTLKSSSTAVPDSATVGSSAGPASSAIDSSSISKDTIILSSPPPPPHGNTKRESIELTEREREYEMALRRYERTLRANQWMKSFSPLENYNMAYVYLLIFFYLASLALSFINKSSQEEKRRTELEIEKTVTELAYLKQQINPHFLFNTLNAIYSYTLAVSEPASDAVLKLSSILRYMLYETNKERVPLADEIAVVYDFIDLQKLRMTDKTDVDVTIDGDPTAHYIEPMLLIPILENAFKFGVDSFEKSFIRIEFKIYADKFTFNVSNKIVRRSEGDESNSGIGFKNIRRRLSLIYGDDYELTTEEKKGIFYVSLTLKS